MTDPGVAFAAFGSAGDLFPFLAPVATAAGGASSVLGVVPRSLSVYLRKLGWAARGLGDGGELRVFADDEILTTDDDGWSSWRRTWDSYVADTAEVAVAGRDFDTAWGCRGVIATDFGVHGRLAARQAGGEAVTLSIYPQHRAVDDLTVYGPRLNRLVASWAHGDGDRRVLLGGHPERTVLLHDRALLGDGCDHLDPVGFPGSPRFDAAEHEQTVTDWRPGVDGPVVALSMGSFLGRAGGDRWARCIEASLASARGVVVVGGPPDALAPWQSEPRLVAVPWVSLDWLLPQVDAVVHHGGIGTTFAAIRSRCPAVVEPIAFDQSFNARLVDRCGAGLDGRGRSLADALRRLVGSRHARERVAEVASRLVPPEVATSEAARRCRELLDGAA